MSDHQQIIARAGIDIAAGFAVIGALMNWLPPIAAVLGIIMYAIQIWESKTVQGWRKRRRR